MRLKKLGKDSASRATELIAEISEDVPLPAGVRFRSEEERVIWGQLTRARARDGWREYDLLFLAKQMQLEADIRHWQRKLDESGAIVRNERGTAVVNPLLYVVDSLARRQLAYARAAGLLQSDAAGGADPRTLNAAGQALARMRKEAEDFDDLIPRGEALQ